MNRSHAPDHRTRPASVAATVLAAACIVAPGLAQAAEPPEPGSIPYLVRAMDCARCHGRDHDGLAAPSILDYARTQDLQRFEAIVLDGDPGRGMPGYRGYRDLAQRIDELYAYFRQGATRATDPNTHRR